MKKVEPSFHNVINVIRIELPGMPLLLFLPTLICRRLIVSKNYLGVEEDDILQVKKKHLNSLKM